MKEIMISIQPRFVEKILNGEKTIEIRKTMPKCELPCKVYIYCTKNNGKWVGEYPSYQFCDNKLNCLNGKVVAEFTLNKIDTIEICDPFVFRNKEQEDWWWFKSNTCLDCEQIMSYIGYGSDHDGWGDEYDKGYAWHIDNLKIYDKTKELSDFHKPLSDKDFEEGNYSLECAGEVACMDWPDGGEYCADCIYGGAKPLTKAPQSWGYVEELEDETTTEINSIIRSVLLEINQARKEVEDDE